MVRRIPVFLLMLGLLVWLPAAGLSVESTKPSAKQEDDYELLKILVDTLDQVERNYVKDVDRRELIEAAIRGVLSELDPYSNYISPDEMRRFRTSVESEFGGIGIQISMDGGQLTVLSPLVGTPAYRAGLLSGDRIVAINGKSTEGITLEEAVRRLKGKAGTKVSLTVIHPGQSKKEKVSITRERISVATVLGDRRDEKDRWDFMLDHEKHIGYIRVTAFSRGTAEELRKAVTELRKAKLGGLILDLRFNPGGLLTSAIEVSDLFISRGRIVSTEGRNSPGRVWDAHKPDTIEGFPMVVLVNRYTASAAEIVAACLQDHKRAAIMGERTWGKGSVQNVISLEHDRSALKLTTAAYRRPNGKNIHRFPDSKEEDEWGVVPDKKHRLQVTDREMAALIHERRQRDILRPNQEPAPEVDQTAKEPSQEGSDQKQPSQDDTGSEDNNAGVTDDAPSTPADTSKNKPQPGKPNGKPPAKPEKQQPVDRLLQMAVDYLTAELARAE